MGHGKETGRGSWEGDRSWVMRRRQVVGHGKETEALLELQAKRCMNLPFVEALEQEFTADTARWSSLRRYRATQDKPG